MIELREAKELTNKDGVLYIYFSRLPIARTKSFASGEVNVDLDDYNEVVGIEILSLGPTEVQALATIVARWKLSLNSLTHILSGS